DDAVLAEGPQAVHADEARLVGGDPHLLDGPDATGGQSVAAHLLAREGGLVDQEDVGAVPGQMVGSGRPGRARADHEHVGLDGVHFGGRGASPTLGPSWARARPGPWTL